MVKAERQRGSNKGPGPTPERVLELVQEARNVAEQFGCSVVITAPGENGTALIAIGNTPELTALAPNQQHVIFPPGEDAQVFPAKAVTTSPVTDGKPTVVDPVPEVDPPTETTSKKRLKPQKEGKGHNLTGLTGSWRGKYYRDGVAQNGNNGHGNHKKR